MTRDEPAVAVQRSRAFRGSKSALRGATFGLTSGVLTTLGLMVGLRSGTGSVDAVAAGVLTIAITDALSDAMGIQLSEKSGGAARRDVWVATLMTFATKFLFAVTFLVPLAIFPLGPAVLVAIAWGALILVAASWYIARLNDQRPLPLVGQHLALAAAVIVAGQLAGQVIDRLI